MKHKIFLAILAIALICVLLISCNDIVPPESSVPPDTNAPSLPDLSFPDESIYIDVSDGDDISDTDVSVPSETSTPETSESEQPDESTVPEVSTVVLEYEWYDQAQLDTWIEKITAEYKKEPSSDGKHCYWYYNMNPEFIRDYITYEINEKYKSMFSCTADISLGHKCDYYGITKEEYKAFAERNYDQIMMLGEYNVMDDEDLLDILKEDYLRWGPPFATHYMFYNYDAWFSDEFWNHPELLYDGYVAPEIDDHYTSLEDRNGYTKRYYIIDRRLIEHVSVDEFEDWLDSASDTEQNIIEFIDHFGITREIYEDIYREDCWREERAEWSQLPYNPDYLFGTAEMQEEYFTVHPLN